MRLEPNHRLPQIQWGPLLQWQQGLMVHLRPTKRAPKRHGILLKHVVMPLPLVPSSRLPPIPPDRSRHGLPPGRMAMPPRREPCHHFYRTREALNQHGHLPKRAMLPRPTMQCQRLIEPQPNRHGSLTVQTIQMGSRILFLPNTMQQPLQWQLGTRPRL